MFLLSVRFLGGLLGAFALGGSAPLHGFPADVFLDGYVLLCVAGAALLSGGTALLRVGALFGV